jgi:hypothetical protein
MGDFSSGEVSESRPPLDGGDLLSSASYQYVKGLVPLNSSECVVEGNKVIEVGFSAGR